MKIQPGLDDQGQKVPRLPWEPKHLTYQEERKSTETLLVVASERRQAISVRSAFAPGGPVGLKARGLPKAEPPCQDPAPSGPVAKVVRGLAKAQTIAWNS